MYPFRVIIHKTHAIKALIVELLYPSNENVFNWWGKSVAPMIIALAFVRIVVPRHVA